MAGAKLKQRGDEGESIAGKYALTGQRGCVRVSSFERDGFRYLHWKEKEKDAREGYFSLFKKKWS